MKNIFASLTYWGPGSAKETTKAFNLLKSPPVKILEIGCGNGNSTITLSTLSDAQMIATDNEQFALELLNAKINELNLSHRITTQCVSMTELNFESGSFDLIWAEASIYIMGVQNALKNWKPLLVQNGVLVFSDLVWLSDSPSQEAIDFWKSEYPDMQNVECRLAQINKAGYQVIATFTISELAWKQYYEPLQERLSEVSQTMSNSQAFLNIQTEVNLYKKYLGEFGYQFFIIEKQ